MTIGSEGAGGGIGVASGSGAVGAPPSSSSPLSCRPSSFPSSSSFPLSSSSAKKEAKSAPLTKSRSASLNKAVEGRTGPGAGGGGGGNSRGGISSRLAMVLSPWTAAPGEASGRFVPRGEDAWTGDCCPLRPNGARVAGGGRGSVQEEEGEEGGAGSG